MKINPINYVKTAYRAAKPSKRILPQGFSEGYFMQKSPLAKDGANTGSKSFITKVFDKIASFFNK